MTWVKVCGLRRPEEVTAAVEAGADAVGFVLADSPRQVTASRAGALGEGAPLLRFLVTVDLDARSLLAAVAEAGADGVQPHGAHRRVVAAQAARSGLLVLHPLRVAASPDLSLIPENQTPLLDANVPGLHGGTGEQFDWGLAAGIERDFVLAGGLGPGNVSRAIEQVDPWGVDASSGLESAPGVKDLGRIRAFVEAAKRR